MSENYKLFAAPKLKLARARQHIEALREEMAEFAAAQPFNMYINTHLDRNPDFLFGMIGPIPPIVSLIFGDAIHCLRAALDLLACDLARHNGKSADGVYFPFASSKAGLKDQIKSKKFDRAGPIAVGLLEATAPFWGGNEVLRSLHALDIADKHKEVLATWPTINVGKIVIDCGPESLVVIEECGFGADTRIGIRSIPRRVELQGPFTLSVGLRHTAPAAVNRKNLFEVLDEFALLVADIISKFERDVAGSDEPMPDLRTFTRESPLNNRPKVMVKNLAGETFLLEGAYARAWPADYFKDGQLMMIG